MTRLNNAATCGTMKLSRCDSCAPPPIRSHGHRDTVEAGPRSNTRADKHNAHTPCTPRTAYLHRGQHFDTLLHNADNCIRWPALQQRLDSAVNLLIDHGPRVNTQHRPHQHASRLAHTRPGVLFAGSAERARGEKRARAHAHTHTRTSPSSSPAAARAFDVSESTVRRTDSTSATTGGITKRSISVGLHRNRCACVQRRVT